MTKQELYEIKELSRKRMNCYIIIDQCKKVKELPKKYRLKLAYTIMQKAVYDFEIRQKEKATENKSLDTYSITS